MKQTYAERPTFDGYSGTSRSYGLTRSIHVRCSGFGQLWSCAIQTEPSPSDRRAGLWSPSDEQVAAKLRSLGWNVPWGNSAPAD